MSRAALILALFASACTTSAPAPIAYGGSAQARVQPPAANRPAPRPQAEGAPSQTPQRAAQAAPDWAAGEGTALSDYAMQAPEFDPANPPRTHRVGVNESLYDIATLYQIPLRALIDQNRLEPPYALTPGREIELPPPRIHRVARGERFEDVARIYNVDLRSLALLNRMAPPYDVRVGDEIVLPAMARPHEVHATNPLPSLAPAPTTVATGARFTWPVRGEIVARFGAQPGGRRIDGLEIAAEEGAPIGAAAAGDVVYAGSDLPGYGALVLVRHGDGFVTAYGYARRALVREGQHVSAGQALAEVGRVAGGRPRVLFQVRQGADAVDPAPLLGAN